MQKIIRYYEALQHVPDNQEGGFLNLSVWDLNDCCGMDIGLEQYTLYKFTNSIRP